MGHYRVGHFLCIDVGTAFPIKQIDMIEGFLFWNFFYMSNVQYRNNRIIYNTAWDLLIKF